MKLPLLRNSSWESSNSFDSNDSRIGSRKCIKSKWVIGTVCFVGGVVFGRESILQNNMTTMVRSAVKDDEISKPNVASMPVKTPNHKTGESKLKPQVGESDSPPVETKTAETPKKPSPSKSERSPKHVSSAKDEKAATSIEKTQPTASKEPEQPRKQNALPEEGTVVAPIEKSRPTALKGPEQSLKQVTPSKGENSVALIEKSPPSASKEPEETVAAYSKKPDPTQPAKRIILLGERHSGTNWITNHLSECFEQDIKVINQYDRYKHWFQDEELFTLPDNSAVVIAMFRDPYDWVEAMRVEPHHAHEHIRYHDDDTAIEYNTKWTKIAEPLKWKEFVTKPWYTERGTGDHNLHRNGMEQNATCVNRYSYNEIIPCSHGDSNWLEGLSNLNYELQRDKSGRAYSSIVQLRRAKILNHLSVATFEGTRAFLPYRFEDLNSQGTAGLLKAVEEATGYKARCEATMGRAPKKHLRERRRLKQIVYHKELMNDYISWMDQYVDWEVESKIGYFRKEGVSPVAVAAKKEVKPKAKPTKPVEKIILLGERHGGTNWITDHLTDCFQDLVKVSNTYARGKHWFQNEDPTKVPENSAVVVAMFRDPYDWVEAMRVEPHHAHEHIRWNSTSIDYEKGWHEQAGIPLEWKEFVTKPWYMERGPIDRNIANTNTRKEADCLEGYSFGDVVPCTSGDAGVVGGLSNAKYELRPDGSERAYSSIIELRRDKILNHLSVANFEGTRAFFPYRFEDLNSQGTGGLLKSVEEATGFKARCNATMGRAPKHRRLKEIVYHDELPDDYIQWMSQYVDWEVESQIGYSPRK